MKIHKYIENIIKFSIENFDMLPGVHQVKEIKEHSEGFEVVYEQGSKVYHSLKEFFSSIEIDETPSNIEDFIIESMNFIIYYKSEGVVRSITDFTAFPIIIHFSQYSVPYNRIYISLNGFVSELADKADYANDYHNLLQESNAQDFYYFP